MNYKETIKQLNDIIFYIKKVRKASELERLYLEYLKLSIKLNSLPLFTEGLNCYAFALGFSYPPIISDKFYELTGYSFPFYVGFIGNRENVKTNDKQEMIENFLLDCKSLGIAVYPSAMNDPLKHEGEKIAFYIEDEIEDGIRDFHFMKQKSEDIWLEKDGLYVPPSTISNPASKIDDYSLALVAEIVKPTLR